MLTNGSEKRRLKRNAIIVYYKPIIILRFSKMFILIIVCLSLSSSASSSSLLSDTSLSPNFYNTLLLPALAPPVLSPAKGATRSLSSHKDNDNDNDDDKNNERPIDSRKYNSPIENGNDDNENGDDNDDDSPDANLDEQLSYLRVKYKRTFTVDWENNRFLKDDQPFRFIGGSFHYFRAHPATWQRKLRTMRAAGLNAVTT